ncbi:hypothetical protein QR685DRAFT_442152, partial [Neurospora intermedia]
VLWVNRARGSPPEGRRDTSSKIMRLFDQVGDNTGATSQARTHGKSRNGDVGFSTYPEVVPWGCYAGSARKNGLDPIPAA